MALQAGDKVWVHLSKDELKRLPQMAKYHDKQYTIAEAHYVRPEHHRGGVTYTIYRLDGVVSDKGLPFWFTTEHLHRYSPKVIEKLAESLT